MFFFDAYTVVSDEYLDLAILRIYSFNLYAAVSIGEFDGVRQYIQKDLLESFLVRADDLSCLKAFMFDCEILLLVFDLVFQQTIYFLDTI